MNFQSFRDHGLLEMIQFQFNIALIHLPFNIFTFSLMPKLKLGN